MLVHWLHKPEVYLYLSRVEKLQHLEFLYGQLSNVPSHSCVWCTAAHISRSMMSLKMAWLFKMY